MSRRQAAWVVAAAGILAAAALAWWLLSAGGRQTATAPAAAPAEEVPPGSGVVTELYFPDGSGRLGSESRELPAAASPQERVALVVRALLAGPAQAELFPPLAGDTQLTGVHLSGDGVVFVDLGAAALAAPPVAGSRGETQAVYSFVNSILANVDEARAVVLLWNGQQRPTFAGHLDTTRPLTARREWLASR